jgi:nicotinamidase-related amidase
MAANAATTRVLLVHLGQPQVDMGLNWDGITALAHMNAVLNTAAEHQIPVCVLCDPHERGRGIGLPTAGNAVCPGLRDAVGRLAGAHVWVADGGRKHSAFHDPAYQAWVSNPAVDTVVVLGFDADVCVRGNVFGIAEEAENVAPARVVPALINFVDVVTARPLLSGGERGIQAYKSWGSLCYMKQD